MRLRVTVSDTIAKAIQQGGLFGAGGGQRRKGGKYIPKKVQAQRDGKTYQTTVWVDPTKEQGGKPKPAQPALFGQQEPQAAAKPAGKPQQAAKPSGPQQGALFGGQPEEAKKPATPKPSQAEQARAQQPPPLPETRQSERLNAVWEALGKEAPKEREQYAAAHRSFGRHMERYGAAAVTRAFAKPEAIIADLEQILHDAREDRGDASGEGDGDRKAIIEAAAEAAASMLADDPRIKHALDRVTSPAMRGATVNSNLDDLLAPDGMFQRQHQNLYAQLSDEDRDAVFERARFLFIKKHTRAAREEQDGPPLLPDPGEQADAEAAERAEAEGGDATFKRLLNHARDTFLHDKPLAGTTDDATIRVALEQRLDPVMGKLATSGNLDDYKAYADDPAMKRRILEALADELGAPYPEEGEEPAAAAPAEEKRDAGREAAIDTTADALVEAVERDRWYEIELRQKERATGTRDLVSSAIWRALEGDPMDGEGRTRRPSPSRRREMHRLGTLYESLPEADQQEAFDRAWTQLLEQQRVGSPGRARDAIEGLRSAGIEAVQGTVKNLTTALDSGRMNLYDVMLTPAFHDKKALHYELQRLQAAEGGGTVSPERIAQHFTAQAEAIARGEALPSPADTQDTPQQAPAGEPDTLAPTEAETARMQRGELNVGDTKSENGRTYRLNQNHRWERADAEPAAITAPRSADDARTMFLQRLQDDEQVMAQIRNQSNDPATVQQIVGERLRDIMADAYVGESSVQVQQAIVDAMPTMGDALRDFIAAERDAAAAEPAEAAPAAAPEAEATAEPEPAPQEAPTAPPAEEKPWTDEARAYVGRLADQRKKDYAMRYGRYLTRGGEKPASDLPDDRREDVEKKMRRHLNLDEPAAATESQATPPERPAAAPAPADAIPPEKREAMQETQEREEERRAALDYHKPLDKMLDAVPSFGFEAVPGGATVANRKRANQAALDLADRLNSENRPPTAEERRVLAAYTGDGGLDVGDVNAHYTPTKVATAMWRLLSRAGLNGGRVLEPSMGAGVFLETAPANVAMAGVELSSDTTKIARLLHPNAAIHGEQAFEEYNVTSDDPPYDAIIANPPYGVRGRWAGIDRDRMDLTNAEDYFIDRSLDRLKDGGLGAFLINPGPLDNASRRNFRARILARAEVLGAVQLTSDTFRESGSGVPPVVLLLRKRPNEVGGTLARLVEKHGEDILKGAGLHDEAFLNGETLSQPENMLGEHNPDKSFRYKHIDGEMNDDAVTRLAERDLAPTTGPATLPDLEDRLADTVTPDDIASAHAYAVNRGYPIPEGTISKDGKYVLRGSRWHKLDEGDPALSVARGLADDLDAFVRLRNTDPVAAEAQRQALAERVRAYVEEHGDPNENARLQERAKDYHKLGHMLAAVEGGNLAGYLANPVSVSQGLDDTNPHAVAANLHRSGRLTPENLARRWAKDGRDEATIEEARAFLMENYALDLDGKWTTDQQFYQGNVPEKEEALKRAAAEARGNGDDELAGKYDRQRARLREYLPRKSLEEFEVTPRSPWIPANSVEAFVEQVLDPGTEYTVRVERGVYYLQPTYGDRVPSDVQDFQRYLNHATKVESVRGQKDKTSSQIQAERKANIERAKQLEARYEQQFQNWLGTSDYREQVEDAYDKNVNNWLEPDWANTPVEIPGWNPDLKLHSWQKAYVAKAAAMGASLNAHDVGLGKTFAGIALLAKLRREGAAKKPMIVCPKSLLPNWINNSKVATPDDKVLVIGQSETGKTDDDGNPIMRDDTEKDVAKKLVQAATGDWDKIIISKNWFATIPITDENVERMTMTDPEMMRLDELRGDDPEGAEAYKGQARRKSGKSARDIVKERLKAEQKVQKRLFKHMVNPLHWEDLGVDTLMVDEAHMYKNLYAAPSTFGQQPKFMGGGAESKQAMDFLFKSRLLREATGGTGIHMLTATPTKNSPLEVFNMLRHIAPAFDAVAPTVDAFVDRYTDIGSAFVPDQKGDLLTSPAVTGFKNLGELRSLMDRYVDRKTASDVGLQLPERDDQDAYFELHPDVRPIYDDLAASAKEAAGKKDAAGDEHLFAYFAKMKKLTLDPALIDPRLASLPNPRYQKAAEIAKTAIDKGGKTVMFMDFGQAESLDVDAEDAKDDDTALDAYDRLVNHLVEGGVPRDQIAVATAKTLKDTAARGEIERRFQKGDIKVVIGSTGVIGEGFNLQSGTTDMVHLNTPWDPGTYWQRLGRAVRQGNPVDTVQNHVLLAKGSFDGLTYSTMLGKRGWMGHLWDSTTNEASNDAGVNQYEEIVSMLSSDPDKAREFMAQKKEEMNQKAEAAKKQASLRTLGDLSRKQAAYRGAQQRLERSREELSTTLDRIESEADPARAAKLRERAAHLEKMVDTYSERADTLGLQVQDGRNRISQDENLPAEFLPLLDPDNERPFLVDEQGHVFAEGGAVFMERSGSRYPGASSGEKQEVAYRVDAIDHVKQKVTLSPAFEDGRSRTVDLADLANTKGHTLELGDDAYREGIIARVRGGSQRSLREIAPERVQQHADAIQATLRENPPSRAFIVKRDGTVEFREPQGANRFGNIEVAEDERFLLNTPADRDLFKRSFPKGVESDYAAPFDLKFAKVETPGTAHGYSYRYMPDDAEPDASRYAIKSVEPITAPRFASGYRVRLATPAPRLVAKATPTGYKLAGRRTWRGLDVSIETKAGQDRSGTDPDGHEWTTRMTHDYGYLRGTEGADGEHLDCFVGNAPSSGTVYVVHQLRPDTGEYDEDKVMLDFSSADAAKRAFERNYDQPRKFYGGMTEWPASEFEQMVRDGRLKGRRIVLGRPHKKARRPELERLLDIARNGNAVRATLRTRR